MPKTTLVVLLCGLVFAGCLYRPEAAPVIVGATMVSRPEMPSAGTTAPHRSLSTGPVRPGVPQSWLPPRDLERRWTAVVIHHSATATGNARIFDRWHREQNQWDGVGYDFVIGNGSDSPDGAVEVTFRWDEQRAGAHCGGTPGNWANEEAVGICLVGDFTLDRPTFAQLQSLTRLVRFLQQRYGIPTQCIYGHGTTPGARITECPGRRFPMTQFKATLDR